MSEELHQQPVIDLEALLEPISADSPSGESVRYSGLYDEVAEARRADMEISQGEWQTELKVADYDRVKALVISALSGQTKDLQLSVWLAEALIKKHGFVGFRDSLRLLTGLHEKFWETIHPEIDEGDMEGRANAIAWLDTSAAQIVKEAAITGSAGYSFIDWEDSKTFDIPDNLDLFSTEDQIKFNGLRTQAEREQRVTAEMWRKEKAATRRAFCEENSILIQECFNSLSELNKVIEEKYDRKQAPGLSNLRKSLDEIDIQVKKLLDEKRLEEPDEEEVAETDSAEGGSPDEGGVRVQGGGSATGAIQSRKDALKRLEDIATFFHKTEPHSPVSYLVQRAVKWGNMPLENWLQDVIKDETILFQLRQTLGFNTGGTDGQAQDGPV